MISSCLNSLSQLDSQTNFKSSDRNKLIKKLGVAVEFQDSSSASGFLISNQQNPNPNCSNWSKEVRLKNKTS